MAPFAHVNPPAEGLPLLLAEHAALALAPWAERLRAAGHAVTVASGAAAVRQRLQHNAYGAIVLDACLTSDVDCDWQQLVRAVDADVPLLVLPHGEGCQLAHGNARLPAQALAASGEAAHVDSAVRAIADALRLHQAARAERTHAGHNHLAAMPPGARDQLRERFVAASAGLWMAYQPIVDGRSHTLYGYEALVRSQEPSLALPYQLFEAAERLGGLFALGRRIRDLVARDVRALPLPDACYLFVNLHARDLLDEELYDVRAPLSQHAERIVFEITERTSLEAIADVGERLARLRALGFRLAIDDLGAGFAGLSTLAAMEPDIVKLDMALVRELEQAPRKQTIVSALTRLCRDLSVALVAEGVETAAERDALLGCGCRLLQGYYFGRPGPGFAPPKGP